MSGVSGRAGPGPTLLLAAHGTQVGTGIATIRRLTDEVRARRPDLRVELAFLDVLEPSLAAVLTPQLGPTIVVPALLCTGYHVSQDIPSVVADRPQTAVSRHLGPDPRLTTALLDRLARARGHRPARGPVALVATGSSNPAAREDLRAAAADLAERLGQDVLPLTLADPDLDGQLSGCSEVASYLLAEGVFQQSLRVRASAAHVPVVSDVLGAHGSVVEVILARYASGAEMLAAEPVDCLPHPAR